MEYKKGARRTFAGKKSKVDRRERGAACKYLCARLRVGAEMASGAAVRQEETDGRQTGGVGRRSECSRCIKAGNSALLLTCPQPRSQRLRMQSAPLHDSARVDASAVQKNPKQDKNPLTRNCTFFFEAGVVDGVASKPSERDVRAHAHKCYLPSDLLMSLIRRRQKDFLCSRRNFSLRNGEASADQTKSEMEGV